MKLFKRKSSFLSYKITLTRVSTGLVSIKSIGGKKTLLSSPFPITMARKFDAFEELIGSLGP